MSWLGAPAFLKGTGGEGGSQGRSKALRETCKHHALQSALGKVGWRNHETTLNPRPTFFPQARPRAVLETGWLRGTRAVARAPQVGLHPAVSQRDPSGACRVGHHAGAEVARRAWAAGRRGRADKSTWTCDAWSFKRLVVTSLNTHTAGGGCPPLPSPSSSPQFLTLLLSWTKGGSPGEWETGGLGVRGPCPHTLAPAPTVRDTWA